MYRPIDVFSAGGPPPPLSQPSPSNSPSERQHEVIMSPTDRDVLNGRGQGVQRHPGNVNYRKLVHVNKVLYAKCPRADKMKISKGIVEAVRCMGGRFLELDERTGLHNDIGDKKAVEKTSQALREGQVDIRKKIYNADEADNEADGAVGGVVEVPNVHEMSPEGYFAYSIQVLQSLYHAGRETELTSSEEASEDTLRKMAEAATTSSSDRPLPGHVGGAPRVQRVPDRYPPDLPPNVGNYQFSVANESPYQGDPSLLEAPIVDHPSLQGPIGRFTDVSMYDRMTFGEGRFTEQGGRFTNMSLNSIFSINSLRQLIESAENGNFSSEDRATIESVANREVHEMIRMALPQLQEIESMGYDDVPNHEDTEVDLNYDGGYDRVSELRFTEYEYGNGDGAGGAVPHGRLANVSEYMKGSTRSLDSTFTSMSITDDHIGGERAGV